MMPAIQPAATFAGYGVKLYSDRPREEWPRTAEGRLGRLARVFR